MESREKLPFASSFRDLIVSQKSRALAEDIFQLTKSFPRDDVYSLTDQIRRSSRSIGAQIAEAWAKRRYQRHFLSKLTDADAEQQETQHWIEVARDCKYVDVSLADKLLDQCSEIGRMLASMMTRSSRFCGDAYKEVRESPGEYLSDFISPPSTEH